MSQARIRIAAGMAVSLLLVAGCSGTPASPSAVPSGGGGTSVAADPTNGLSADRKLLVLAEGTGGIVGLWALDSSGWSQLGNAAGATGIGTTADGIAIATGRQVEVRPASALSSPGSAKSLKWSAPEGTAPIVSLSTSPSGKLAIAAADAKGCAYFVAAVDGSVAPVGDPGIQSFTPQAAWLDESHLLILAMDRAMVSRLTSMNTTDGTLTAGGAVTGIRVAGLSGDRATAVVATEAAVYVGSVPSLLGQADVQPAVTLNAAQIVWALTLDASGSQLFFLSGQMAPDGVVGSIRELAYAKQGDVWVKMLDVPVPFGRAVGQVLLG